ncbi:oligosaccharide flippase family protein [Aerococcus urinaeequi]|uniref:Oligosaccharide flippase family protein n=1 Tax=Aerococcus urinaeequi TaxID=51665 RepID=A0AA47GA17_9LACT|nr:oligosaccharide flippase family protein [Aerococcus urinaeequi]WAT23978.1 oligosaccharide flippase family protein [Aerococcus urinaeequi]
MKVNQLKSGVILSYLSRIIQIVVGIVYTPLMIRLLGQSEYGLYNIAASIIAYLGILNFGFGSAYMRFFTRINQSDNQEKIANLNGMFLEIFSFLGLLAVIAGIIVAINVNLIFGNSLSNSEISTTTILILVLVVNLAFSFPSVIFTTYIQANEKFVVQYLMVIALQITTPLVNLPLLLLGFGSIGMVVGTTTVNIIINIMTIVYAIKKLNMRFSFSEFDVKLFKEMSSFSFFVFINMIVDQINNNIDKTILGRYQGTTAVAVYSVGSNLNLYYTQLSTSISTVFIPRVHKMEVSNSTNNEITNLFIKVGRLQFILLSLVFMGFLFFGKSFVQLWAGIEYGQSYYIAIILMFSIATPLIQNLGVEIQRAKNLHQFRSWLYVGMAIGNVLISIPMSQKYGAIGVTIGTAFSYIIGNGLVMNLYNHYKVGLNMRKFWKEIFKFFPALLIVFIFGLVIHYYVDLDSIQNLVIFGLLFIFVFFISMWFLAFNENEKKLLTNPFK